MIEENGYLVVRGAIPFDKVNFIADQLTLLFDTAEDKHSDPSVPGAFARYDLLSTNTLLLNLWNVVEEKVGLELAPTYSYMRYYEKGQKMRSHVDRLACEYSITANIWNEKEPWPIWFLNPKGYPSQVDLEPGDVVIYKGCDITHWRDTNTYGEVIQVFLHYVDVNGPNAEWAYDRREDLRKIWDREKWL